MDKLAETPLWGHLLPIELAGMRVEEANLGPVWSVAPFARSVAGAVDDALGMAFPAPNQTTRGGAARCIWVGRGEALLTGAVPDPAVAQHAAVVDQSDAWAWLTLTGTRGDAVLARLVPVDLRLQAFAPGATVRTQLGHMNASITRLKADVFLIAVFRSMAATLVHDLTSALEAVAARG